jgi:UDP-2,4-diacetamido-2,4,6-trideoxy-beta-L-altropyranose hydrolase
VVTIALRADGGAQRGFGHVRRMATLAQQIRRRGDLAFLIVNHEVETFVPPLEDVDVIAVADGEIASLTETISLVRRCGADVLVVDSYDVTPAALHAVPVPLAVVLDSAPEVTLPAALLISAAVPAAAPSWPVARGTRLLLGAQYALLRDEFVTASRPPSGTVRRVLVTTGGTDVSGWIVRLARIVLATLPDATVDVIVGPCFASSAIDALGRMAATAPLVLHHAPPDICRLMASADVAVTGGGQTLFELAAAGTPVVAVALADNQRDNIAGLASAGALAAAGEAGDDGTERCIADALAALAGDPEWRSTMSRAARAAVDGRGASRVAECLSQLANMRHASIGPDRA